MIRRLTAERMASRHLVSIDQGGLVPFGTPVNHVGQNQWHMATLAGPSAPTVVVGLPLGIG